MVLFFIQKLVRAMIMAAVTTVIIYVAHRYQQSVQTSTNSIQ